MLEYEEWVPKGVLNERIRFDVTSLTKELASANLRGATANEITALNGGKTGTDGNLGGAYVRLPIDFSDNMVIYNGESTRLYYLGGRENNWKNYQGDEFNAKGNVDLAFRLPPVPDGTYELRYGLSTNDSADGSPDTQTGWTDYKKMDDMGLETDIAMHNLGWMRGPLAYTMNKGGSDVARGLRESLRRVIARLEIKQGTYWLRVKSALDDDSRQMYFDYLELVPVNVYNNPRYLEDMY